MFNPTRSRGGLATRIALVSLGLTGLGVAATAGVSSAHGGKPVVSCVAGYSLTLTNYNGTQPNHLTVLVDGVTKAVDEDFSGGDSVTVPNPDDTKPHLFKTIVRAWDDPVGTQGFSYNENDSIGTCPPSTTVPATTVPATTTPATTVPETDAPTTTVGDTTPTMPPASTTTEPAPAEPSHSVTNTCHSFAVSLDGYPADAVLTVHYGDHEVSGAIGADQPFNNTYSSMTLGEFRTYEVAVSGDVGAFDTGVVTLMECPPTPSTDAPPPTDQPPSTVTPHTMVPPDSTAPAVVPPVVDVTTTVLPNPGNVVDCSSFATQADAQAYFDKYSALYGDVANLDADGDGHACEASVLPTTGSNTGQELGFAFMALAAGGGLILLAWRRHKTSAFPQG